MIHRIVLTGDVFRSHAGEREQLPNVEWLRRRFAPMLKAITGIEPEIRLAGPPPFDSVEPVCNLYRIFGENAGINSWAKTFFLDPPSGLIKALEDDYANSLVISIELSPLLERVLDKLSVPWIDVGISPLRFMPDFAISFRMSHHFENRFPSHLSLSDRTIDYSVARIREYYSDAKTTKLKDL